MFRFLETESAAERMDELERFLAYWYGPARPEYGETEESLAKLPLPYPLRRFYAVAGRRPSPEPDREELFYTGGRGHHLRDLEAVEETGDGKLDFFMEYQGDWSGLTLPDAEDPPVWLRGCFEGDVGGEENEEGERTLLVCDSLSKFLVTHCLMTTLYEDENAATVSEEAGPLVDHFNETVQGHPAFAPDLIWDATASLTWPPSCLDYEGKFYLTKLGVLVQRSTWGYRFGALRPTAVRSLLEQLQRR